MSAASRVEVTFYSLATQFENLGDCVINELLMQECVKAGKLIVLCRGVPLWLMDRLQRQEDVVLCDNRTSFFVTLMRSLLRRDRVSFCFKPGHMGARRGFASASRLLGVLMFCFLIRCLGVRVLRAGVSLDNYTFPEKQLQGLIGKCHTLYGVRDSASLEYARSLGITKAVYSPDLAFLLPAPRENQDSSVYDVRRLAVSFRERGWTSENEGSLGDLLGELNRLAESSERRLTLIQQVDFDNRLSQRIRSETNCEAVVFSGSASSAEKVFLAHAETDIMVSNRLHALIFSWSCGAVPVAIVDETSDKKIRYLLEQLGLRELIVTTGSPESMLSQILSIDAERELWKKRLCEVFSKQQAELREYLNLCRGKFAPRIDGQNAQTPG